MPCKGLISVRDGAVRLGTSYYTVSLSRPPPEWESCRLKVAGGEGGLGLGEFGSGISMEESSPPHHTHHKTGRKCKKHLGDKQHHAGLGARCVTPARTQNSARPLG
jgi:hypothetical protein